ncbi:MAG: glycosyltransferase [Terriglobales bacterium]
MPDEPRVGLVNKFWGRDRGGVEAVLHAEAGDLAQRGFRVSVLACRPAGSAARLFPPGVEGRELPAPVIASMPVAVGFYPALRRLSAHSDLLHFHLPFPLAEAAALCLPKRIPWIATLHAEVIGRPGWIGYCQRQVTRRFLNRADAIVVSSASSSQCRTLAALQEWVQIIPFGFDLKPFLRAGAVGRPRRPPVIAFLGRLVPYKGVDVLLRAAANLAAHIHILGDGRQRQPLERLTAQLGLTARVHFFGHVPDADLPQRLHDADVLALPSRTPAEMFGVAQVEAMATGLPVVNTALATGTDWVSLHGLTGLTVAPDDAGALASALQRLLDDRPFRLACGRRARQRARELFSIERRGPEFAALCQALLP